MRPAHQNGMRWVLAATAAAALCSAFSAQAGAKSSPASDAPALPGVAVLPPPPPTDAEMAGDNLYQFILHHATAPFPTSEAVFGSLARWRGGRPETICPRAAGLAPAFNEFVTARVRAIAAYVGAPVQSDDNCQPNVPIVFTTEPRPIMKRVLREIAYSRGVKYLHQIDKQLEFSNAHAIQGFYLTAGGGGNILNVDAANLSPVDFLPIWPLVIQTGLHGAGCCNSGIITAAFVIDANKITGYAIGSLADYVAMLALSRVQQPDHCDPLQSILDLMAPSCSARARPAGITAADLAFLKALYYRNTGLGPSLSRDDIQSYMLRQLKQSPAPAAAPTAMLP